MSETAKRVRALNKKLRQIDDIRQLGGAATAEQRQKLTAEAAMRSELQDLEKRLEQELQSEKDQEAAVAENTIDGDGGAAEGAAEAAEEKEKATAAAAADTSASEKEVGGLNPTAQAFVPSWASKAPAPSPAAAAPAVVSLRPAWGGAGLVTAAASDAVSLRPGGTAAAASDVVSLRPGGAAVAASDAVSLRPGGLSLRPAWGGAGLLQEQRGVDMFEEDERSSPVAVKQAPSPSQEPPQQQQQPQPQPPQQQAAAAEEEEDPVAAELQKKIRNVNKKLRQVLQIQEMVQNGVSVTIEQRAKLGGLRSQQLELKSLEQQLQQHEQHKEQKRQDAIRRAAEAEAARIKHEAEQVKRKAEAEKAECERLTLLLQKLLEQPDLSKMEQTLVEAEAAAVKPPKKLVADVADAAARLREKKEKKKERQRQKEEEEKARDAVEKQKLLGEWEQDAEKRKRLSLLDPNLAKQIRNCQKKLRAVQSLRKEEQSGKEMTEEQLQKLATEGLLVAELRRMQERAQARPQELQEEADSAAAPEAAEAAEAADEEEAPAVEPTPPVQEERTSTRKSNRSSDGGWETTDLNLPPLTASGWDEPEPAAAAEGEESEEEEVDPVKLKRDKERKEKERKEKERQKERESTLDKLMNFKGKTGKTSSGEEGGDEMKAAEDRLEDAMVHLDEFQHEKVTMADFELLALVGQGGYGKVFQVRCKRNLEIYALKSIDKHLLERCHDLETISTELAVLKTLAEPRHSFLCALECAFQCDNKLCLVMNYLAGGMLFAHLCDQSMLSEKVARFYAAEVMLALEHLHSKNIMYRDLKPENILIASDGHIKLCDFGLCSFGLDASPTIAGASGKQVLVGTTEYMAPEIIRQCQPIGQAVDIWAVGVLIFEMMVGNAPWDHKNAQELQRRIVNTKPKFPNWMSNAARGVLNGLLTKDPLQRLGVNPTNQSSNMEGLKRHPFFNGINWRLLLLKRLEPPFTPKLAGGELDTSMFDIRFTSQPPQMSPPQKDRRVSTEFQAKIEDLDLSFLSPETRTSWRDSAEREMLNFKRPTGATSLFLSPSK